MKLGRNELLKRVTPINPNIIDAVSYISKKGIEKFYYLVKCTDCDFTYKVYNKLKKRKTCRYCISRKEFIGKKFGRLTVLNIDHIDKKRQAIYWNCLCDCENYKSVPTCRLNNGDTKSCGCFNLECSSKLNKGKISPYYKPNNYSAKYKVFSTYRCGASDRGIVFDLSFEDFEKMMVKNCHYCNSEPKKISQSSQSRSKIKYNGIDRVDSQKGYAVENCVPCCSRCNSAKSNSSLEEFEAWITQLIGFRKSCK